jgi:hypothetical protein
VREPAITPAVYKDRQAPRDGQDGQREVRSKWGEGRSKESRDGQGSGPRAYHAHASRRRCAGILPAHSASVERSM